MMYGGLEQGIELGCDGGPAEPVHLPGVIFSVPYAVRMLHHPAKMPAQFTFCFVEMLLFEFCT